MIQIEYYNRIAQVVYMVDRTRRVMPGRCVWPTVYDTGAILFPNPFTPRLFAK